MAKKEKLQSSITVLNSLLIAFLTALFAILSYSYLHFSNLKKVDFIILSLVSLFLFLCILLIFKNIKNNLKQLEKE